MSVAVSPYLTPSQALALPNGLSNGHQGDLLDALLASCQKSAMNPRLPGFGRNLQPYFSAEVATPRLDTYTAKGASPAIKREGRSKKAKAKSGHTSPISSSDEETPKLPAKHLKTNASQYANKGQTIKAVHPHQKAEPTGALPWAGPTFGMAPAPSEIPFPSEFLLV